MASCRARTFHVGSGVRLNVDRVGDDFFFKVDDDDDFFQHR